MKPIKDLRTLEITFPFPDTTPQYHTQPTRYLSHLIGHEADGSILSFLKNKGWSVALSAGISRGAIGFEFFKISVELTPEGLDKWEDVVLSIFGYIKMMKAAGVQRWIWEETAKLQDIAFRFREKRQPSSFVSRIAGQMQLFTGKDVLSGPYLMEVFDQKLIEECLDALDESAWRVTIVSQNDLGVEGPKQTERWYGTEYSSDDIAFLVDRIKTLKPDPAFHLPAKNDFIPENLHVDKPENPPPPRKAPKLLLNTDAGMLWHKKDDVFFVPKAHVYVMFRTPVAYLDPFASVAARMFTELLRDHLVEYAYFAEVADLHYSLESHVDGILLSVSGYNDKIPVLLERVLAKIKSGDFITDQRFPLIRELLSRSYANWKLESPHSHALYNTTSLLQDVIWTHAEKTAVIEDPEFTADAVRAFVPQVFARSSVEMLVHGNVDEQHAIAMWETISKVMKMKPLTEAERKKSARSMLLPPGSSWVWEKEVANPDNVNSAIEYYLEVGDPTDVPTRCRVQLLTQIAYEPCFDQLRTKEQLGYLVWSGHRRQAGTIGFRVIVQSERDPAYVETRIESFLVQLRQTLEDMSEEDYKKHVDARVLSLLEKDKTLASETMKHWNHIEGQGRAYEFDQGG